MVTIKTFCRRINTNNSQKEVDTIDYNINKYIKENNISYSDIKQFEITKLETHPDVNTGSLNGSVYLVYTLIIEKWD